MKSLLYGSLLGAALTLNAPAQVFKPIDPRQIADISSKVVEMPTMGFNTVPQPIHRAETSPLSGKWHTGRGTVETRVLDTELLQYPIVGTKTIAQANFAAKRAVLPDKVPTLRVVETDRAPVTQRTIRPLTPAGMEELKEQLRTPH